MPGTSPFDSGVPRADQNGQLVPFDFQPATRVVFGPGTVSRLAEFVKTVGGSRVLLVTDSGLAAAGHEQRSVDVLRNAGLDVTIFDDVHPNPTTADVDRGLDVARAARIDVIVGLGGGSSMDCAKGINFLLTNGGKMRDYMGIGKATKPMLPMIAVPTTAGTGSEAQSFALIADEKTHMKMACGDKKAACRIAVLDPELTLSMPESVTSATGIDAIAHAVETYVTRPRTIVSQLFSRQAWQLLSKSFAEVLDTPRDAHARGEMLLGSHLAGAAIENSMLGAAHALANPLSARFDVTHGIAVGVMLPHVVRYNAAVVGARYGDLAADAGLCDADDASAGDRLAEWITAQLQRANLPTSLEECDVDAALLSLLAQEASRQWTATFNPRPVDADNLEELYRCAFSNDRVAG